MMDKLKSLKTTGLNTKKAAPLPGKYKDCISGIKGELEDIMGGMKDVCANWATIKEDSKKCVAKGVTDTRGCYLEIKG